MRHSDPPFKQALKEAIRESFDAIRSLWWLWLIGLAVLLFFFGIAWFFSNYGPGTIYEKIGKGELPS